MGKVKNNNCKDNNMNNIQHREKHCHARRFLINTSILLLTALLATACKSTKVARSQGEKPVQYVMDGTNFYVGKINNEFIYRMLDMAYSGQSVTFSSSNNSKNENRLGQPTTYTYSTSNREAAFRWARRMAQSGFTITVSYNKNTAKYHCVATK